MCAVSILSGIAQVAFLYSISFCTCQYEHGDLLFLVFCVLIPALKARFSSSYYSSVKHHRLWHCFFCPKVHNRNVYLLYFLNVVPWEEGIIPRQISGTCSGQSMLGWWVSSSGTCCPSHIKGNLTMCGCRLRRRGLTLGYIGREDSSIVCCKICDIIFEPPHLYQDVIHWCCKKPHLPINLLSQASWRKCKIRASFVEETIEGGIPPSKRFLYILRSLGTQLLFVSFELFYLLPIQF